MGGVDNAAHWVVEYLYGMSLAEWFRVAFAIIVGIISVLGTWSAYRFSKGQIVKRLNEFLDTQDQNILSARKSLLRRLEFSQTLDQAAVHRTLMEAFALIRSAHLLEAQTCLDTFKQSLLNSAQLGERHRNLANRQAATVLLFMGIIALRRAQMLEAQNYWQQALELSADDADVLKWMGELKTKLGDRASAIQCYQAALNNVGADDELKADILWLRSQIHSTNDNPLLQKNDLRDCAPLFFDQCRWQKAGPSFERLGDLCSEYGPQHLVEHSFSQALVAYKRLGEAVSVARMRDHLGISPPQPAGGYPLGRELLAWLKLTFELTILLWALFMLTGLA